MHAVEHYREAEERLRASDWQRQQYSEGDDSSLHGAMHEAAMASVHAVLALAGATALQAYSSGDEPELDEWQAAAGGEG